MARGQHATALARRAAMSFTPRSPDASAGGHHARPPYRWLGKEVALLPLPPRRTVRTRHRVHGSGAAHVDMTIMGVATASETPRFAFLVEFV